MSQQLKKKYLASNSVDGTKLQLLNNQAIRAQNFAGDADIDIMKLDASDTIIIASAPHLVVTSEESASLQTKAQIQASIDVEKNRALSAEALIQASINASNSALMWRASAIAVTGDAGLASATDGDELASLLPFSDDEAPAMVIGDFTLGDFILSSNGASSKLWQVYDDAGTLKLTDVGFDPLASDHTLIVKNDLMDSPAGQENRAIYNFSGTALVKLGDFDWSLASGIDLSASYASIAGVVVAGDSVEMAIGKISANVDAEKDRAILAEADLAQNILDEKTRAELAEGVNATAILTEKNRAELAEGVNATAILTEKNRAIDAETALQDDINAEVIRAGLAEVANAQAVVTEKNRAEGVEATLTQAISDEATRATTAEGLLGVRIDNLASAVPSLHKMKISLTAGDIANGYVDLAHKAVANSIDGFSGRLAMHQTEDYTVSEVGGVSRITFVGSFAEGQAEGIEAGDDLFFKYQF